MDGDDVKKMLNLGETLFVEHKKDESPAGDDLVLQKAVSAFANTYGGWLLLGVENSRPTGAAGRWLPDGQSNVEITDDVRQRLRGWVDPLPVFEARVVLTDLGPVGVVRVA